MAYAIGAGDPGRACSAVVEYGSEVPGVIPLVCASGEVSVVWAVVSLGAMAEVGWSAGSDVGDYVACVMTDMDGSECAAIVWSAAGVDGIDLVACCSYGTDAECADHV